MVDHTDRRRFLQAAGTGTVLSLAGCSAFQLDGGDDRGASGSTGGEEATVTVAVQPDREALRERRSEIQSRVQSGNLSRQEARMEMQSARAELMRDATGAFERRVDDESALAIEDSVAEIGAYRVTGSTTALIGTLSATEVGALLPESRFEEARSRASARDGSRPTGTPQ